MPPPEQTGTRRYHVLNLSVPSFLRYNLWMIAGHYSNAPYSDWAFRRHRVRVRQRGWIIHLFTFVSRTLTKRKVTKISVSVVEIKQSRERTSKIVQKCVTNIRTIRTIMFSQTISFVYQFSVVWSVSEFIERDCFIWQRVVQNVMWVAQYFRLCRVTAR